MKFILKRTSRRFSTCSETNEEALQNELQLISLGLQDFKDKIHIEDSHSHVYYPAGEEVDEIKVPIIELDSLDELLKVVDSVDVVIAKNSYYDYPVLEIYDDYRE